MFLWKLVFILTILYTTLCDGTSKDTKADQSNRQHEEQEDEEWYDPCESIWWRRLYRISQPSYQDFEHFLDCLRDYAGIYASQRDVRSLGHSRDVPRGWWSRYRAHTHNQVYPDTLDSYELFESHVLYLRNKYQVHVDKYNFPGFWNETDIPEEWWERYESSDKATKVMANRSKSGTIVI